VCGLPAFRSHFCQRHYKSLLRGNEELTVERQIPMRGYKRVVRSIYVSEDLYFEATKLAKAAEQSFAAWASDLIEKAVEEKTGVKPRLLRTIYGVRRKLSSD
jgi:hypothetical protein